MKEQMNSRDFATFELRNDSKPKSFKHFNFLKSLKRREDRAPLIRSYYIKSKRSKMNPDGLYFLKTGTFYEHQPLSSYRTELAENHARFWQMQRLKPLLSNLKGVPTIESYGEYNINNGHGSLKKNIPDLPKLDYVLLSFAGHVDLRTYVCANDELVDDLIWLKKNAPKLHEEIRADPARILSQVRKTYRDVFATSFPGLTPKYWYGYAAMLTAHLKRIHNRGLIHGALCVDSVRLKLKQSGVSDCAFIDFEESSRLTDLLQRQKGEMRLLDKAEETHDITGLGEILFYLATGKEWINEKRRVAEAKGIAPSQLSLRKHDTQEIVSQCVLGNSSDRPAQFPLGDSILFRGIAKIIDKCLRDATEDQYLCCEDIIDELDLLSIDVDEDETRTTRSPTEDRNTLPFREQVKQLEEQGHELLQAKLNTSQDGLTANYVRPGGIRPRTFLHNVWKSKMSQLERQFDSLLHGHYEIHGDREELIDHLTRAMSGMNDGDIYLTLTHPGYWSSNNLGSHGRFLSMNQMIAVKRNIHTIRLFVCNHAIARSPLVRDLLKHHCDFQVLLRQAGHQFLTNKHDIATSLATQLRSTNRRRSSMPGNTENIGNVPEGNEPSLFDKLLSSLCSAKAKFRRTVYYTGIVTPNKSPSLINAGTLLGSNSHVAVVLSRSTGSCISITFYDHPKKEHTDEMEAAGMVRQIHKVRFQLHNWRSRENLPSDERVRDFIRAMDINFGRAKDLIEPLEDVAPQEIVTEGESSRNALPVMMRVPIPGAEAVPFE